MTAVHIRGNIEVVEAQALRVSTVEIFWPPCRRRNRQLGTISLILRLASSAALTEDIVVLPGGGLSVPRVPRLFSEPDSFPYGKPLFINDSAARGLQEERQWLVSNGFSELLVKSDGTLVLSGQSTSDIPQTLAISLPTSAKAAGATAFPAQELPAARGSRRWLGGIRLVIWPASSDESHSSKQFDSKGWTAWAGGITDGFLIEVSAPVETDEQTGHCTAASLIS